ncbi:MAG: hypothetical protein OEV94_07885 [Deltaproteobacteria bacterium]|nr:hypothetical protein [Deltaproteobacteria bacterium]
MTLTRRQILQWTSAIAAGTLVSEGLVNVTRALAAQPSRNPILWFALEGGGHTQLTHLTRELPEFLDLVTTQFQVERYDWLEPAGVDVKTNPFPSAPVLVLEGVPSKADLMGERYSALRNELSRAKAVVMLGTEACYGGFLTPTEDLNAFQALCKTSSTPVVKLPGIPVPPHHIVGTLAYLELGFPRVDAFRRPVMYYSETVCQRCERRGDLEQGRFSESLGEPGCLYLRGCKGPVTHNTCAVNKWNGGENWCVGAGSPCTGCSDPSYPDFGGLGLYGRLPGDQMGIHSTLSQQVETAGWGMFGLAGMGLALHLLKKYLRFDSEPHS